MYTQFFNPFGYWQNAMQNYSSKATKIAVESGEKAVKHQISASQAQIETATKHFGALINAKSPDEFFKLQAAWAQESFSQFQADSKAALELAQETASAYSKLNKDALSPNSPSE